MRIGYEAKRVYQNTTGLGNYARNLITAMAQYTNHELVLFAPKITGLFHVENFPNIEVCTPKNIMAKSFPSLWRTKWVVSDIEHSNIHVFHGLSAELPIGIHKVKAKKIVTIHDLIFEKYPEQYKKFDRNIYISKTKNACSQADRIIAISQQTKNDLVELYNIDKSKISIVPPICNPFFYHQHTHEELADIKKKYNLPDKYFLYVGSLIERKGLLQICKAIHQYNIKIPVVVIGGGENKYSESVKNYIQENKLQSKIIFLNNHPLAQHVDFTSSKDLPGIYQNAYALILPSIYEGFGMPITEALCSGIPVIAGTTLSDAVGDAGIIIAPQSVEELANAMMTLLNNHAEYFSLKSKTKYHAALFSSEFVAKKLNSIYND